MSIINQDNMNAINSVINQDKQMSISSVFKKLQEVRIKLQGMNLKKTGYNKFSQYYYFELGDFIPQAQSLFNDIGLCGYVSYGKDMATLTIQDMDGDSKIEITSPMAEANLKGCHPIQNLGAVETYIRRYLWVTALELVEHDAVDSSEPKKEQRITPTSGAWERMSLDMQNYLLDIANGVRSWLMQGDVCSALDEIDQAKLDADAKIALWTRFDSKERAAIKKEGERRKIEQKGEKINE